MATRIEVLRLPRLAPLMFASVCLCGWSGCGGPPRGSVEGHVTLDGQPVADGTINLIPTAGEERLTAWGRIVDGQYTIAARRGPGVGQCRVEIRWPKKTGRQLPPVPPANEAIDEVREVVPERYNTRSELTVQIEPGQNVADFTLLTSQRP